MKTYAVGPVWIQIGCTSVLTSDEHLTSTCTHKTLFKNKWRNEEHNGPVSLICANKLTYMYFYVEVSKADCFKIFLYNACIPE